MSWQLGTNFSILDKLGLDEMGLTLTNMYLQYKHITTSLCLTVAVNPFVT